MPLLHHKERVSRAGRKNSQGRKDRRVRGTSRRDFYIRNKPTIPCMHASLGEVVGEKIPVLGTAVEGLMEKPVITVSPKTNLRDAEQKMRKFNISCLVVASDSSPVGIVTKRDLLEPIAQSEMERGRLFIQFSVKDLQIDEMQRNFMLDDFESFARKYREALEEGTLFAYLKTHGTNHGGEQLVHCRLQLRTRKGMLFSAGEGFGVEQTFSTALDRFERQILRSKELEYDPELPGNILDGYDFP